MYWQAPKINLNKWITVKANVKEDFKKFHNLDVNELRWFSYYV